jgi:hypothetical protein
VDSDSILSFRTNISVATRPSRPSICESYAPVTPSVQVTETPPPQPSGAESGHGMFDMSPGSVSASRRAYRRAHSTSPSFSPVGTLSSSSSPHSNRQSASQPATPPSNSISDSGLPNSRSLKPTMDRSSPFVIKQSPTPKPRHGRSGSIFANYGVFTFTL